MFEKKKKKERYLYYSVARFIVSKRLMTCNYPDKITYAFL
jgi:hypothetical protein